MISTPEPASWLQKRFLLGIAALVAIIASGFFAVSGSPRSFTQSGIPVPFVTDGSRLAGEAVYLGKRNNIDVYEVTFTAGQISEPMSEDRIYLVHVPRGTGSPVSLDAVITGSDGVSRNLNFYGYRYADDNASSEKFNINALAFKDRFPGQFFASDKARSEDPAHGDMLAAFEAGNSVTFKKTDGTSGGVTLDPTGSLYVFIVNEPQGAMVWLPANPVCGNGSLEPGEECDDADTIDTNSCSNACKANIPLPFDAVCGNGAIEAGESCDDGNVTAADGCSALCKVESGYVCLGKPSVCSTGNPPPPPPPPPTTNPPPPPPPSAVCGNGLTESGEACDDGNTASADGCSDVCAVESGYACIGEPSVCTTTNPPPPPPPPPSAECGNNVCETNEQEVELPCPDGIGMCPNVDYCPADCSTPPPPPALTCGNGSLETGEACDDGNTASADGCSDVCQIEADYQCSGTPSVCTTYLDIVLALADTNNNGTVSDTEALLLTLTIVEAPTLPYAQVSQYDMDLDGDVDSDDTTIIIAALEILAPTE